MPSSVIRDFTYLPDTNTLELTFSSGRRYRYRQVPPDIYREMRASFSKGEFFNAFIRGRYVFEPVSPAAR